MLDLVVCEGPPPARGAGRTINTWRDEGQHAFAEAASQDDGYRIDWRGVGTLTFAPGSLHVRLWPAPGVDASAARSAALRIVQPIVLQAVGRQTLHASAARLPGGAAVAFCGVSSSGKSTLAFALGTRAGAAQLADDAVVLDIGTHHVDVTPLPFLSRLRPGARGFFGDTAAPAPEPASPHGRTPLGAIFTLVQSKAAGPVELTRTPATAAFTSLLTHAHCFDDSDRAGVKTMVEAYLTVAGLVPVYRLTYPADFSQLSALAELVVRTVAGL